MTDIKELPYENEEGWDTVWVPESPSLEKNFDGDEIKLLKQGDYPRPSEFNINNIEELEQKLIDLNKDIKEINGRMTGRKNTKDPSPEYAAESKRLKEIQGTLKKYKNSMKNHFKSNNYKEGQGINYSPQELLKRFELLDGSLSAGNNGVLSEYIQIAHRLRDLGVVTNNQLNTLLRKHVNM